MKKDIDLIENLFIFFILILWYYSKYYSQKLFAELVKNLFQTESLYLRSYHKHKIYKFL